MNRNAKPFAARRAFLLREFLFDDAIEPSDPDLVRRYAEACYTVKADTPSRFQSARTALYRDIYRMGTNLDVVVSREPRRLETGRGRSAWASRFELGPEGKKWLAFEC